MDKEQLIELKLTVARLKRMKRIYWASCIFCVTLGVIQLFVLKTTALFAAVGGLVLYLYTSIIDSVVEKADLLIKREEENNDNS